MARAYALSGNPALRARAALFIGGLELTQVRQAQGHGGVAGAAFGLRRAANTGHEVPSLLPFCEFLQLVREMGREYETGLTWAPAAVEALRCAAEAHAVALMQDVARIAAHGAKRSQADPLGVGPRDVALAARIRGEEAATRPGRGRQFPTPRYAAWPAAQA